MPSINASKVLWKEKDGIVTLLLLHSGNFFELNRVGSKVWTMLASGLSPDAIIDAMLKTHDVAHDRLAADVHTFIARMQEMDVLEA